MENCDQCGNPIVSGILHGINGRTLCSVCANRVVAEEMAAAEDAGNEAMRELGRKAAEATREPPGDYAETVLEPAYKVIADWLCGEMGHYRMREEAEADAAMLVADLAAAGLVLQRIFEPTKEVSP